MDEKCYIEPIDKAAAPVDQILTADRATLSILGMGCDNCATRVRNGLLSVDGVFGVDVYLNMALAEVSYDSVRVSADVLLGAVSRAGNDGRHEYRARLAAAQ